MDRRTFLKASAVLGITSAALPSILKAYDRSYGISDDYEDMKCQKILKSFDSSLKDKSISDVIIEVGKSFMATPYVAGTLDKNPHKERLVVYVTGLDCVTFCENALTMSRIIKQGDTSFDNYKKELTKIRYRDGVLDGYPSRLHYFSDWIYDNEAKGIVRDITKEIGGVEYNKTIDFMTTHTDSYPALKDNPDNVAQMQTIEANINSRQKYYIPVDSLPGVFNSLQSGDIIGITSDVTGLDIAHTGIIYKENNIPYFLNASLKKKEVIISEGTIQDYILGNKKQSGVMVCRPL
jgi:hypothetical protein